tara:strand:- start:681 stop:1157 length:477 start_codon:yes stop_codon:yes gene_type:complete
MVELLDRLTRFKKDYIDPPEMTTREQFNTSWVYKQMKDAGFLTSGMKRLHLDSKYWACSKKEFEGWIKWDWTNKKKFIAEEYDCDNFAFSFKARCDRKLGINTVALVIDYSGGHAYNLVCFTDAPAELYEPQSDRWVKPNDSKSKTEFYALKDGYIIL